METSERSMKTVLQLFTKYKYILLVVFLSLFAVLDLSNFGIPPTHDGEYHVLRFQQFYKVLSEGNLYPRWAPDFNNGYGIPLFNYVYPLPNYITSGFHALGFGFIDSFKLNMAVASILGAIFMYLWTKKYWGELGGVVSSVFYTFSPYHFLDIYVRGSVGEVWSLGLAPGLFWAYSSFFESKKNIFLILSSVFLALLVYSHNILALIFFGFFIIYASFLIWESKERKEDIKFLIIIIFLGLGLSAPFWFPALIETKYVTGLQVFDPTKHFPQLYKLIYSSWGYGFSGTDAPDQMSFQIGIANLIAFLGSVVVFYKTKKRVLPFFIFAFIISIFLITPFSSFLWNTISLLSYVQFPWRFLSVAVLIVSFLVGSLVMDSLFKKRRKLQIVISLFLIVLSITLSIKYLSAPFYHQRTDQHYLTRSNFTDGTNSPGNSFNTKWLSGIPEKRNKKIEFLKGEGDIKINEIKSTFYSFSINSKGNSRILINTAYFPGWTAISNGNKINIQNYNGRMLIDAPKGFVNVRIYLQSTEVQKISSLYFLISILILGIISLKIDIIKK